MPEDRIQFMMEKILHFETFEDRLTDLEMKNEELEEYLIIMKNQIEKLTQNNNLIVKAADPDPNPGSNFAENSFEDNEMPKEPFTAAGDIPFTGEMNTALNGSNDGNIENQESNFTHEEIKSEGNEWTCNSNMIEENVENPAFSSSSKIPTISISSEREFQFYKSNLNIFSQYKQKIPKILQNVVIPLKRLRIESGSNFIFKNVSRHSTRIIHSKKVNKAKANSKRKGTVKLHTNTQQNFIPKSRQKFVQKSSNFGCICSAFLKCQNHLEVRDLQNHSRENPISCSECPQKFTQKSSLDHHMTIHRGEKQYKCPDCQQKFKHKGSLTVHKRTHTGEKPYNCPDCPKKFNHKWNLTVHKRTHTGEKPNICPDCPKKFNHKWSLTVHKRTHTGEKPYNCPECPEKFNHKRSLTVHKRTHTGEKPYNCPECPKKFNHNWNLTVHKRTHTGEKPYNCPECPEKFYHNWSFTVHMRSHNRDRKSNFVLNLSRTISTDIHTESSICFKFFFLK